MDCNKDEALRAKQIAESRMQRGNFVEALKFVMKAKNLYPDVENIAQILSICEVHIAAQNKLSKSDMDWYGILRTERFADEATIKKQYRKLALLLHPDKNKFAGAEAAFKLIGEANRVLSDQVKRSLYDMNCRISLRTPTPKTSFQHSTGNAFTAKHHGNATNYQNSFYSNSTCWNTCQQAEQQTFWTFCKHCKTRYQYYKCIVNTRVCCQKCLKCFTAHDLGYQGVPPVNLWTSVNLQNEASKHGPPKPPSESNGAKSFGGGHADTFVRSYPVSRQKCAAGVGGHCKDEKNKDGFVARGGETGEVPASKAMESRTSRNVGSKRVRQSAPDSGESFSARNGDDMKDTNIQENNADPSIVNARRSSRQKKHVSYAETSEDDDSESPSRKPRQNESYNTDEDEKRKEPASGGLSNENNSASFAAGVGDPNREVRNKVSSPDTILSNKSKFEQFHVQREEVSKSHLDLRTSKEDNYSPGNSNVPSGPEIIPDADFSDFEKDKAEDCFAVNQFWAIYDPTDTMPRFYALVKKVASPFKLQITWLEPDPDDQGEIDWFDADLPIACGKFRIGNPQQTVDRAMFSHQMHCMKGSGKGSYLVYPEKGETWAIFRDWNIKWSCNPKKHLKYEFEYVEILSDFAEDVGIQVAYLGKVKGFACLFRQTENNGMNMFFVLPNELYRFSHRIPSYKMTGNEREGIPRGSFELDPAALPVDLFNVSDSGDMKIESEMLNIGVEQLMANERIGKAMMNGSNGPVRDTPRGLKTYG